MTAAYPDGKGNGRVARLLRVISRVAAAAALGLPILLLRSAQVWSCFQATPRDSATADSLLMLMMPVDTSDSRHRELFRALNETWSAANSDGSRALDVVLLRSSDINAASLGRGRFLLWTGLSDLPAWSVDAVMAHEVAHDALRHSKKAAELQDLTDFVAEVFSLFSGSDERTDRVIRRWTRNLILPKYSRSQEYAADSVGALILAIRGYDAPRQVMAACLELIRQRYGDSGGGMFDYHPSVTERISRLRPTTDGALGRD